MRLRSFTFTKSARVILALLAAALLTMTLIVVPQLVKRDSGNIAGAATVNSPLGMFTLTSEVKPTDMPAGGGTAKLTYTVTNTSGRDLYFVRQDFNTCSPAKTDGGSTDNNGQLYLSSGATATFSCYATISQTTDISYTPTWAYSSGGTWYSDSVNIKDTVTVASPPGNLPSCDTPWFSTFMGDSLNYNNLGTVNTSTGAMDSKMRIWNAAGIGSSAMGIDPLNPQYAYWGRRSTSNLFYTELWRTDLTTGERFNLGTPTGGTLNAAFKSSRMAVDANGTLWTFSDNSRIYKVDNVNSLQPDALTSNPSLVTDLGTLKITNLPNNVATLQSGDIAFDGTGTMWVLAATSVDTWLLTIGPDELRDPTGIDATVVGKMTPPNKTSPAGVGTFYLGLAFDSKGTLYASSAETVAASQRRTSLYTLNKDNGAATLVGTSAGAGGVGDLASCALPAPNLVVEKTATPSTVRAGDTITYRIDMRNTGNLTASGVTFQDLTPAGTTYVPGSAKLNGNPIADVNGDNPWATKTPVKGTTTPADRAGVIPAGDEAVVEFQVKVGEGQDKVCNQGQATMVSSKEPVLSDDPNLPGATDQTCVKVAKPGISLDKKINGQDTSQDAPAAIDADKSMDVSFEVKNEGDIRLDQVSVTDDIIPASAIKAPALKKDANGKLVNFNGSLEPGESATLTATWWPEPPLHHNTATASGRPPARPGGQQTPAVTATDEAWATTPNVPKIGLVKKINGEDANETPVNVVPGSTMDITYEVTNKGNGPLRDFEFTDDKIDDDNIAAPTTKLNTSGVWVAFDGVLYPGEMAIFTATYPAPTGTGEDHENIATVTANAPKDLDGNQQSATATDNAKAHTPGAAAVTMRKYINGDDADNAPGVRVDPGSKMQVKVEVTNTGTAPLDSVSVIDKTEGGNEATVPKPGVKYTKDGAEVLWNDSRLEPGEKAFLVMQVDAPGPGNQHRDVATVTANPKEGDLAKVTDDDPAHAYTLGSPSIAVVKKINGNDANTAPGTSVNEGDTMNVTFDVTNNGSTQLDDVTVSDDVIPDHLITPADGFTGALQPGETAQFTATYPAPAPGKTHTNTATVSGNPPLGPNGEVLPKAQATDVAHAYTAGTGAVTLTKKANGFDANEVPYPVFALGSDVTFTFEVTNTGTTPLRSIRIDDDKKADFIDAAITPPVNKQLIDGTEAPYEGQLEPGESAIFTAKMKAPNERDQVHTNNATVTATPVKADDTDGEDVTATDSATFRTPGTAKLEVVKKIKDDDANSEPGVTVEPGSTMPVTFEVTNTGTVPLSSVSVQDDVIPDADIKWPENRTTAVGEQPFTGFLAPGETATFTASWPAPEAAGQKHKNIAVAVGQPPADGSEEPGKVPEPVKSAPDEANANTGEMPHPGLTVVKRINGDDANEAPGVEVTKGAEMNVTIEVTNSGDADLTNLEVADSIIPANQIDCGEGKNVVATLAAGARITCNAHLQAPLTENTLHGNVATATGKTKGQSEPVIATDPALAHTPKDEVPPPADPKASSVEVKKLINGQDADTAATAVEVTPGSPMAVTFRVTNTGETTLTNVRVTDKVVSGQDGGNSATEVGTIDSLEPGDSQEFTATLTAPAAGNTHLDIATVTATPPLNDDGSKPDDVRNEDPGYAVAKETPVPPAQASQIGVVKLINGVDSSVYPGVEVAEDSTLNFEFTITNLGQMPLTGVSLTDSVLPPEQLTCAQDLATVELQPGDSVKCTATLPAPKPGETHTNVATATAHSVTPDGTQASDVSATDVANATVPKKDVPPVESPVDQPSVKIVKKINSEDANEEPGVKVRPGSTMTFTYEVTNTGNTPLVDVGVTDNILKDLKCDTAKLKELKPGEKATCSKRMRAPRGRGWLHLNVATVTATPKPAADNPEPAPVRDNDHAFASPTDEPPLPVGSSLIPFLPIPILIPILLPPGSSVPGSSNPGSHTPPPPGQPSQPNQPGQPQQPGQPGQPGQPAQPSQTGQPNNDTSGTSIPDKARGFLSSTSAQPVGLVLIALAVLALSALLAWVIRRGRNDEEDANNIETK